MTQCNMSCICKQNDCFIPPTCPSGLLLSVDWNMLTFGLLCPPYELICKVYVTYNSKIKGLPQYQPCWLFPAVLAVRRSWWGSKWTTGWLRQKGRKTWRSEIPPPKTLSSAISARCRSAGCHWGVQSQAPSPPCPWLWWPRRRIKRVCCPGSLMQQFHTNTERDNKLLSLTKTVWKG